MVQRLLHFFLLNLLLLESSCACPSGQFPVRTPTSQNCLSCECSGVSKDCRAARLVYESILTVDSTWKLADFSGSIVDAETTFDGTTIFLNINQNSPDLRPAYWLAPEKYTGNCLTSYGTHLQYTMAWRLSRRPISAFPILGPTVVLISAHGLRIGYFDDRYYPAGGMTQRIPLSESGWFNIRRGTWNIEQNRTDYVGEPVTRLQMLQVLGNLKHLMIRTRYSPNQMFSGLVSVSFFNGTLSRRGRMVPIEQCDCPSEYSGLSCENCAFGYRKILSYPETPNSGISEKCVKE